MGVYCFFIVIVLLTFKEVQMDSVFFFRLSANTDFLSLQKHSELNYKYIMAIYIIGCSNTCTPLQEIGYLNNIKHTLFKHRLRMTAMKAKDNIYW